MLLSKYETDLRTLLVQSSQHSPRQALAKPPRYTKDNIPDEVASSDQPSRAPTCARACCDGHAQIMLCTVQRLTSCESRPAERDAILNTWKTVPNVT